MNLSLGKFSPSLVHRRFQDNIIIIYSCKIFTRFIQSLNADNKLNNSSFVEWKTIVSLLTTEHSLFFWYFSSILKVKRKWIKEKEKAIIWGKSYGCKNCFNFPRSLTHPPVQDNNGFYQFQKRKILWFQARFRRDERILSNNYRMKTSWLKQTYWLIKGVCFSVLVYLKIATYKQSYWIYQKMTEFYFVKNCHLT